LPEPAGPSIAMIIFFNIWLAKIGKLPPYRKFKR